MKQPSIYKTKSGIVIMPKAVLQLLGYTRYYIHETRRYLDEYQQLLQTPAESSPEAQEAKGALCEAEQNAQVLDTLQDELQRIYTWNFERLAEVFRQSRIFFEQRNILDIVTITVVLNYLMDMLQAENPKFDREQFITYINSEQESL